MALSPTIYKFDVALSDLNRNHYDQLALTVAQHPSETTERMLARVLAYCLNADEALEFCKGLSDAEEPDLWSHTLDGQVRQWIEVGEPESRRIKKASRLAPQVLIYSFNSKSDAWWTREGAALAALGAGVYRFDTATISELAGHLQRTMRFSLTLSEQSAFIALDDAEVEVPWVTLHEPASASR